MSQSVVLVGLTPAHTGSHKVQSTCHSAFRIAHWQSYWNSSAAKTRGTSIWEHRSSWSRAAASRAADSASSRSARSRDSRSAAARSRSVRARSFSFCFLALDFSRSAAARASRSACSSPRKFLSCKLFESLFKCTCQYLELLLLATSSIEADKHRPEQSLSVLRQHI